MYNVGKRYNTGEQYNITLLWRVSGWYTHLGHALPVVVDVVDKQLRPLVLLHQAHNIFVHETLAGEDKLTFDLPSAPPELTTFGALLDLAGKIYRVVLLRNQEDDQGLKTVAVEAWALWYDLIKMPDLPVREWRAALPLEIMTWLLAGSGWTVGTVTVISRRNFSWEGGCNYLEALRKIEQLFNAEIVWDTMGRQVSLIPGGGVDTGVFFLRGKNLRKVDLETNFADTVHRLYPRGYRGLTIAAVNKGIPYLEVPSPISPPPSAMLIADEFTDPAQLKEYAEAVFATMRAPQASYMCEIIDLSALPGHREESVHLGDIVTVFDEDTGINIKTRIVRMRYSVEEPWNSEIELSTVRQDLSHALGAIQQAAGVADTADAISTQDIAQLMVFNHLLNSRADDGFAYWINDGWEIDSARGVSGPASFRAAGVSGMSKTLTQTVYPAHRNSYVISLQALLENVSLGPQGKVGVEIVVHYTDSSSETHFLSLLQGE